MQKVQLAAALVAALGFTVSSAHAAETSTAQNLNLAKGHQSLLIADNETSSSKETETTTSTSKGKDGSCSKECKSKKKTVCKKKAAACKGKENACKGGESSCKAKQ
jgi:hypothetical protein